MLDVTLKFLKRELDTYLLPLTDADGTGSKITLSRIVDDAGKYVFPQDQVGVSLLSVEEERIVKSQFPEYSYVNGQHVVTEPDLKLNLYIMFAAYFKDYAQGWKYLSSILLFFQSHPNFTPSDFPALDPEIEKLILELQSPGYEQLSQIWTFVGGKQLPSIIYKARLLVLQPVAPTTIRPPITKISALLGNR